MSDDLHKSTFISEKTLFHEPVATPLGKERKSVNMVPNLRADEVKVVLPVSCVPVGTFHGSPKDLHTCDALKEAPDEPKGKTLFVRCRRVEYPHGEPLRA